MKNFKKIIKISLYMIIIIIILTILKTILEYFNITNYKINNIINISIPIISFAISGYKIGKKTEKKGWLEGIKLSSFIITIMLIITLSLNKFKLDYLIYLIILTTCGTFGSMLGINK